MFLPLYCLTCSTEILSARIRIVIADFYTDAHANFLILSPKIAILILNVDSIFSIHLINRIPLIDLYLSWYGEHPELAKCLSGPLVIL